MALTYFKDGAWRTPGGLVAVKSVLKTDTQVESAVAAGASFDVTGLSITHALSDASNKLIISAYFGIAQESTFVGRVGIAVADNGTLINVADVAGTRFRFTAGVRNAPGTNDSGAMPSFMNVYSPGDTNSHTYTVRAISGRAAAMDIYINRTVADIDGANPRATSGLVIQEVSV